MMTEIKKSVRNRQSKSATFLLSFLLASGAVACGSEANEEPAPSGDPQLDAGSDAEGATLARIEVTPAAAEVKERRTVQLEARAFDTDDAEVDEVEIGWASSDEDLASVDATGLVTALRPGKVTITASASGKSGTAVITITEAAVASVEIDADATEVPVDGSVALVVTAKDEDGVELLGRVIAFTSEDESKATVSEDGKVFGIDVGETKITAEVGGIEATLDVRIVHRFEQIFAGAEHTCGLTALGRAWCWGSNFAGALGNGDETRKNQLAPVRVVIDPTVVFQTLALGEDVSCGLTKDEAVWCWGDNHDRQLGRDSAELELSATPLPLEDRSYAKLSAMGYAVCGLDDEGKAHCWGYSSSNRELGDPNVTESSATPVAVSAPVGETSPIAFRELHHGRYHSCGLGLDERVYCWGSNWFGQLGDGTLDAKAHPFDALAGTAVSLLGLGTNYTCALTKQQTTYCWGANGDLQIDDSGEDALLPAERFDEADFVPASFALGDFHGCALDAEGRAWCWGSNRSGQLGRATNDDFAGRDEVEGGLRFEQLVSGTAHICGLATDGKTYCWGQNYNGQTGIGDDDESVTRPTPVAGQ